MIVNLCTDSENKQFILIAEMKKACIFQILLNVLKAWRKIIIVIIMHNLFNFTNHSLGLIYDFSWDISVHFFFETISHFHTITMKGL